MDPLSCIRECLFRVIERKRTLLFLILLFLCSTVCGIVFVKTPAMYEYHLRVCDRFLDRVCFSSTDVFLIFLERTAGHAALLALVCASGVHVAALVVSPAVLVYRAYTFGGSLAVFFSVYGFSGALIAVVLYMPVHLLIDAALLCSATLAFGRAPRFRFCAPDLRELFCDFLVGLFVVVCACLFEMTLLFVLFHPLGNIL